MKEKSTKPHSVYVPEGWEADLKAAVENDPPKFKPKFQHDYAIYIGQLPLYLIWNRHKQKYSLDEYLPINKQLLQGRIHNYKMYLDYLVNHDLLEDDKHYIVGKKSTGFRYPPKYASQKPVKVLLRNHILVKNLKKNRFAKGKESEPPIYTPTGYDYLDKWFNENLKIDKAKAEEILLQLREKDLKKAVTFKGEWVTVPDAMVKGGSRRYYKKFDPEARYIKRYITALRIYDGSFDDNGVDTTTGRYHSPIVRLKKELRETITYGGNRLVSVDIRNSQPFLLGTLTDPKVFASNGIGSRIYHYNPSVEESLRLEAYLERNDGTFTWRDITNKVSGDDKERNTSRLAGEGYIMLVDFINQRFQSQDVQEYLDWVTSGTFYEKLGDVIAPYLDIKKYGSKRDAAKNATYGILFGRKGNNKKAVQVFRARFPTVAEIVDLIKHGNPDDRVHRTLSCTLQVMEADIILNNCCRVISQERPDLPIFTVHDSILTLQGEKEYVKSVMETTISRMIGYTPKLECQNW